MRCAVGDIAQIVDSIDPLDKALHAGKVVCVVAPYGPDAWVCEPQLESYDGTLIAWLDASLRPLRDNDGVDEVLRIAGHPLSESHRAKAVANDRLREFERKLEQGA